MIKKTLLGFFIFFIFSCDKYSSQFLEEKPFTEKITPQYFSKTVDSPSDISMVDEIFRKQIITIKDRARFSQYSKIYFDEDLTPVKIENYRRDSFNDHIYYPYLILKIEKNSEKVAVAATEKTWQNGQLITSSVKMNFFDKQTEGNLTNLIEAFRKNKDSSEFANQIFRISFIADDTPENKNMQTRLTQNVNSLKITGKEIQASDVKINLFLFPPNLPDAAFVTINQASPVRVRFAKYSPAEGIDFTYLGFDMEKIKALEQEKKDKENQKKSSESKDTKQLSF